MLRPGRCSAVLRDGARKWPFALGQRRFSLQASCQAPAPSQPAERAELLRLWHEYGVPDQPLEAAAAGDTCVGFLGKRRNVGKNLSFADLTTSSGEVVQLCSDAVRDGAAHSKFRQIPAFAPVRVRAEQEPAPSEQVSGLQGGRRGSKRTFLLRDIRPLNSVPSSLIVTSDVRFPQTKRHLQVRFHPELQARLRFRSWLKSQLNRCLLDKGFVDVETPTLFKSTPEGAREFLVPTRQRGTAYALSQSPQQYKQVLMASGIARYMQWARCYRDEDLRTDRQPEFTQLDLEWAFSDAAGVMKDVTDMVLSVLSALCPVLSYREIRDARIPVVAEIPEGSVTEATQVAHRFTTIPFADSITAYGTDKPDLRIPNRIHAIPDLEPIRQFVSMITHLADPLVEFFVFPLKDCAPGEARQFVRGFMDALPSSFNENPDGKPQVLICDSSQPLCGFSSLGPEYETVLSLASGAAEIKDGDLVVFQARQKPTARHNPSSTRLGDLRSTLWRALVEKGHMEKPRLGDPGSLQFVWVTEFPMFKPVEEGEPGQGGAAGIAASHHPFTAPLSAKDLDLMFTEPLEAKSAAYDLVLNGVEIGGGSERNHIAEIQAFIMRDVLQMPEQRMDDFAHLFEALRAGCPPHAGFALGFDRFVALMTDTWTVRDVMAFPKTMKGEDPFVRSPSRLTDEQLAPYGLELRQR